MITKFVFKITNYTFTSYIFQITSTDLGLGYTFIWYILPVFYQSTVIMSAWLKVGLSVAESK